MAILKVGLKILGVGALTLVFWLGFNVAAARWQAHKVREANLDAVIYLMDYNIKAGKLDVPKAPEAAK